MTPLDELGKSGECLLTERACGGWLATTPNGASAYWPRIGVTAATGDEARTQFRERMEQWVHSQRPPCPACHGTGKSPTPDEDKHD